MLSTTRKAYKYKVTFTIQKVKIGIGFSCSLMVFLKKGKKRIHSKAKIPLDKKKFEAKFNESMKFESIYIKDLTTNKYLEEKNRVTVLIHTHKGNKTGGVFDFIPTDFLNSGRTTSMREAAKLIRCPDKKARFYFGVSFVRVAELDQEEFA